MRTIEVVVLALVWGMVIGTSARGEQGGRGARAGKFSCVFLSDARIEGLKEALAAGREPTASAFDGVRRCAEKGMSRRARVPEEWYVPRFYRDAEGHHRAKAGMRDDGEAAYALALAFRMTGERRYGESAARLIDAWVKGLRSMSRRADSMLAFSYHFPTLIFAADLIRDEGVWGEDGQKAFMAFLREKALPMSTMGRKNNWGNWGLVLSVSCAAYLGDERLFGECAERWKVFIDDQIAEDGHLRYEVERSGGERGIWYSHFCLMPQTIAGEILAVNGTDLFEYRSPNGRTLREAFEKLAGWTENPGTFPYWEGDVGELKDVGYFSYFEILNGHWRNGSATRLLAGGRPMTATHTPPFLTFTHGGALSGAEGRSGASEEK